MLKHDNVKLTRGNMTNIIRSFPFLLRGFKLPLSYAGPKRQDFSCIALKSGEILLVQLGRNLRNIFISHEATGRRHFETEFAFSDGKLNNM